MEVPEIESRWGMRFLAPVQTIPGAHPASYTICTASFAVVKRPERGVYHPLPSIPPLCLRGLLYGDLPTPIVLFG
jgi:hypothetical protein